MIPSHAYTGAAIQSLLDAPDYTHPTGAPWGRRSRTIELQPGRYLVDQPIIIRRPVRLVGNNTLLQLNTGKGTFHSSTPPITKVMTPLIVVAHQAGFSRIEGLSFRGAEVGFSGLNGYDKFAAAGIGINILGGRVIVEDCTVYQCAIGVLLSGDDASARQWPPAPGAFNRIGTPTWDAAPDYSNEYQSARAPLVTDLGLSVGTNSAGTIIRDCDISQCLDGLIVAPGSDSSTSTFENLKVWKCRRGITEASAFGSHYVSNYIAYCPDLEGDIDLQAKAATPVAAIDQALKGAIVANGRDRIRPTLAYGIYIPPRLAVNASTFTANWLEDKTLPYLHGGTPLVVGGNLPATLNVSYFLDASGNIQWAHQVAERLGQYSSAVRFRGGPIMRNQADTSTFGSYYATLSVGAPQTDDASDAVSDGAKAFAHFRDDKYPGAKVRWWYLLDGNTWKLK